MTPLKYQLFFERHLPHYQPVEAILFVTFRLAGSLPREAIARLTTEVRQMEAEIKKLVDKSTRQKEAYLAQKYFFGWWDAELDARQYGPEWLAEPPIANLICDALHYRHGKVYTLEAFCLMPNHIHVVFSQLKNEEGEVYSLSRIMHSLKGYTARQANMLLGRQGDFWQHESYDHVIRDNDEFNRIVNYVLENPARAGLSSRWIYSRTM